MNRGLASRLLKLEGKGGRGLKDLSTVELHAHVRGIIDELGGPEAAYPLLVELAGDKEAEESIRWYHARPDELRWFGSLPPRGWRPGVRPRDPLR